MWQVQVVLSSSATAIKRVELATPAPPPLVNLDNISGSTASPQISLLWRWSTNILFVRANQGNTRPSVNQVILMQACFWPVWKVSILQIASLIGSTRVSNVCQFRFRCAADTRRDALLLYQVVLSSQPSTINGCFWYLSWSQCWSTGCVPGTRGIPTVVLSVSAQLLLLQPATGQLGPGVVAPTLYGGGVPCYRGPSYHPLSGISIIQVPDQFFSSWANRPLYQLFYLLCHWSIPYFSVKKSFQTPTLQTPMN